MTGELPPLIQPQISLSEAIIILDNSTLVLKHPADAERGENLGQKCIFACLNGHVRVYVRPQAFTGEDHQEKKTMVASFRMFPQLFLPTEVSLHLCRH